ncbi:syntaxin-17 [Agrilus planipennis]|uniref:Syntaxin-17 n=1 Tax=Agrilus planipennis TaxID=224129 RepID=A0A1W4WNC3_AGRPL|nr:syntaxin-17 [Agrilus planipennis]
MSSLNTLSSKQPFKFVEIPLNKFTNEAIPHHKEVFKRQRNVIRELIAVSNYKQTEREIQENKRIVQQLRHLMYELDTLRTQVQDSDLDKFDSVTLSLRKDIITIICNYTELEKFALSVISQIDKEPSELEKHCYENPLAGVAQIQLQEDINDIKLAERQNTLNQVEEINNDIEELHDLYTNLNELVHNQAEQVNEVENHVQQTNENVTSGLKQIIKAAKLKRVTYPITGALIGGVIGGPIGLIGGLKIGGLAAVGCGIMGYTGGKIINKCNESNLKTSEVHLSENKENEEKLSNCVNKKDI